MEENDLFLDYVNNGNEESFNILMKKINKWLPSIVYRIVGDKEKTKDVVQDTWIKVIETKHRFNPDKGTINNRIFTIGKNYALKKKKKMDRRSTPTGPKLLFSFKSDNPNPYNRMEENEGNDILYKALSKLKIKCQEIINFFYFEDFSYNQISEVMSVSLDTVKMRLHHCKKKLAAIYRGME
ncbi:RNA polymerase sigma factor [Bacteroidota bacterium]